MDDAKKKSLNLEAHEEPLTPDERVRSLVAVIACITVVGIGMGSSIPLLALLMDQHHLPAVLIGLNTAMPAVATFALTPFLPRILRRVPPLPFLLGCVILSAAAMPCYYISRMSGSGFRSASSTGSRLQASSSSASSGSIRSPTRRTAAS